MGLVRFVVTQVVRIELMAANDPAEAASLVGDTLEAARKGITDFTGKNEYRFGDLTRTAISKFADRAKTGIANYTGKDAYEFGDITKATVRKYTGKDDYEFGDITKATVSKITGKEDYEFGDITKTALAAVSNSTKSLTSLFGGSDDTSTGPVVGA